MKNILIVALSLFSFSSAFSPSAQAMTVIQSIKVRQAVFNTGTSGTLFTCGSTGYAIVQVHNAGAGTGLVSIGGAGVATVSALGAGDHVVLYVGPSQALSVASVGGATWTVQGVEFINS